MLIPSRVALCPISLARITVFLATSIPERSSRGSGSVYPNSFAFNTRLEKGILPSYDANNHARDPEKIPEMLLILSPVLIRSLIVEIMGSPAPTVAS